MNPFWRLNQLLIQIFIFSIAYHQQKVNEENAAVIASNAGFDQIIEKFCEMTPQFPICTQKTSESVKIDKRDQQDERKNSSTNTSELELDKNSINSDDNGSTTAVPIPKTMPTGHSEDETTTNLSYEKHPMEAEKRLDEKNDDAKEKKYRAKMKHMQEKRRKFLKTFFMVDHDGMSAQQFAATAVKSLTDNCCPKTVERPAVESQIDMNSITGERLEPFAMPETVPMAQPRPVPLPRYGQESYQNVQPKQILLPQPFINSQQPQYIYYCYYLLQPSQPTQTAYNSPIPSYVPVYAIYPAYLFG